MNEWWHLIIAVCISAVVFGSLGYWKGYRDGDRRWR